MTRTPFCRSRSPRRQGRFYTKLFHHFRQALTLSLVALLTIAPLNLSVYAGKSSEQNGNPETTFEAKADKLLEMVHDAAATDRASGVKARSPRAARGASAEDDGTEIGRLSRIAGVERKSDGTIKVGLTVELTRKSDAELKAAGFIVGARIGRVATVETEVERLPELAALASVREMEAATYYYPTNDLARQAVKIDNASGQRVVPQTGRGVVVGIIDSGIDFRHLDFTVPGSNGRQTRIKALLDMTIYDSSSSNPGWNYSLPGSNALIGHLYTEAEINQALQATKPATQDADPIKQRDKSGHGTHVAGIAAGNGLGGPTPNIYSGMAPEADLVIVKASRQNTSESSFRTDDTINGIKFIQQQAAEMNKPFVINLSLGGHAGPHSGLNDDEMAIDELVNSGPGRVVCISAGNEGSDGIHASGYVPANGEIELKLNAKDGSSAVSPRQFDLYYSNQDHFSITITRPDGVSIGPYAFNSTGNFIRSPDPHISSVFNGPDAGLHDIDIRFRDTAKDIKAADGSSIWTFKLRGDTIQSNGRFDVWIADGSFQAPYIDNSRTISSPGTSQGAITVGAFVSRQGGQRPGESAVFSSQGPTLDGRPKPDISAPGRFLYSSKSSDSSFGSSNPAPSNGSTVHAYASGTSMSSPVVTGTVALLLQANPNLSSLQIKRFLTNYADHDSFNTHGWDARFGHGKINAAAALNAVARTTNSIDNSDFFVRQQYLDFLFREPDTGGFNAWVGVLNRCPNVNSDPSCDRIEVSASFFRSDEFQIKGYFVYRFYKVSFGRQPRYVEIIPDMKSVTADTPQERDAKKAAFARAWVTRPEFKAAYPDTLPDAAFVDKLLQTEGITLSNRDDLVRQLQNAADKVQGRADVLRAIVESAEVDRKEYNPAFVAMQYFGYLRRDAEPEGFEAWLRVINRGDSYRVMVDGFANSPEYKQRFGY